MDIENTDFITLSTKLETANNDYMTVQDYSIIIRKQIKSKIYKKNHSIIWNYMV